MSWAGVIGSPIEHSLSPLLHRAAWDSVGVGSDWTYRIIEVTKETLPSFLSSLDSGCLGLSVTMPCKQDIMSLIDVCDPLAQAVGSVNTVVPSAGVLTGFNTDVHGIVMAIDQARARRGCDAPHSAVILGSGATAASSLAALGTLGITRTTVIARRFGGPGSIVVAATRLGVEIDQVLFSDHERVMREIASADILISTLPAHIGDDIAKQLSPNTDQCLLDVIYSPRDTQLVQAYEANGACVAYGVEMLLHQAHLQVQLMTGKNADVEAMRQVIPQ